MNIVIFRVLFRREYIDLWHVVTFLIRSEALAFFRTKRLAGRECILTECIETQIEAANLRVLTKEAIAAPDLSE